MVDEVDHRAQDGQGIGPGVVLEDTWEVIAPIGKGSFSEIFLAQDINRINDSNRYVAVKVQGKGVDVLKWESSVLQNLDGCNVPKFYAHGFEGGQEYLVMELLTGEDMATLRNRIRGRNPTGLVPLPIAAYFARKMINCLQQMHEKGYVHRDVKPSNFVRKSKSSNEFLTIDFGLAKQYKDKDGNIRPCRERAEFRGTTIYASPFAHEQQDQCPRDDIFSVMHVFLDMTCGKLPWGDAARAKDKPKVIDLKKLYYDNIDALMTWEANLVKATEQIKNVPVEEENFPALTQQKCKDILTYLLKLKYEDVPNYSQIEMWLFESVPDQMENNVGDVDYQHKFFSWAEHSSSSSSNGLVDIDGIKPDTALKFETKVPALSNLKALSLPSFLSSLPTIITTNVAADTNNVNANNGNNDNGSRDPLIHTIRNLHTRVSKLQDLDVYAKYGNNETQAMPSRDLQRQLTLAASRWRSLFKDLIALPEARISKELISYYGEILAKHKNFFDMNIENWTDFIELQLSITQFYAMQKRIRQRIVIDEAAGRKTQNIDQDEEDNAEVENHDNKEEEVENAMVATPSRTEASHRSSNSASKRNREEDEIAHDGSTGRPKRERREDESELESEQEEAQRQLKERKDLENSEEGGKMEEVVEPQ